MTTVNPVIAIDLSKTGPVTYPVSGNAMWLVAKVPVRDGTQASGWNLFTQDAAAVIGVQIGDATAEMIAFGAADPLANMFVGAFDKIIVTVIKAGDGGKMYLNTGSNLGIGYSNGDGQQPYIGCGRPGLDRL